MPLRHHILRALSFLAPFLPWLISCWGKKGGPNRIEPDRNERTGTAWNRNEPVPFTNRTAVIPGSQNRTEPEVSCSQLINKLANQSVSQLVRQPLTVVSQLVSQSVSQSASQLISHLIN